jgi:hypothetical protein
MLTLEDDVLAAHVRATMGELLNRAEQLKGLAQTLDGFCELSGRAHPDEIKQVAVGVMATAVHAILTAVAAAGLSERLATVAAVLERTTPLEDDSALGEPGEG